MGELEVRGPSISSAYYESPDSGDRWTDDGWFKTGDIVTIGSDGYVEIQDRAKDLVKSGGEWISTVALENALMGHPAIAEAAVIAVPDEKWSERPLAVCVLREGASATDDELREYLAPSFAKFWLPDRFEFVEEIPKTAVGKFRKTALREQFASPVAAESQWTAMGAFISTERHEAVALVTIDNPPMNALASALLEELEAEIEALDADDDVRAIVLRGAGERAFVAGADIKEFPALRESAQRGRLGARDPALGHRMDAARTPFVAAIRGFCLGGGLELAMCCDVRVCADDAQARPARDQARADPGRRRHAAAAAARRPGARDAAQPHRRVRRRRHRVRVGPRREGRARRRARIGRARGRRADRGAVAARGRRPARARPHDPRPARSRRACAARPTASSAASAPRTARRASPRSSRSGRRRSPGADRMKAIVLDEERRLGLRDVPEPEAAEGQLARRRARSGDQLRRRPDQRGPVPAGAAPALRARQRDRRGDGRRPTGDRLRPRGRRRVRRARGRRRRLGVRPPGRRVVRGRRGVPARVPHGVDAAHAAGTDRGGLARPRHRGGGRRRQCRRPGRTSARRRRRRGGRLAGEARPRARARRRAGDVRGDRRARAVRRRPRPGRRRPVRNRPRQAEAARDHRSGSASPAARGSRSTPRCSSGATSPSRGSTSAG